MASPLFDAISVQHSRNIGDAVAAAATDGSSITSAQRTQHINNAIRRFIRVKYLTKDYDCIIQYINESAATAMTSNLLSLSGLTPTVAWIIDIKNTTGTVQFVKPLPQELQIYFNSNVTTNSFLQPSSTNQYWTRKGTSVQNFGGGATDNLVIRYVAQHTALSAGGSSDILIDNQYYDIIYEMALQEYYSDYPDEVNAIRMKSSTERLNMLLGN
jgi:hypothetical protein